MKVRDPVCGREMEPGDVAAMEYHEGWAYFFCSPRCHEDFNKAPGRFAKKPVMDSGSDAASSIALAGRRT